MNRLIARVGGKPASTIGLIAIFGGFALDMLARPHRWSNTPAYGTLLTIMPIQAWGLAYALVAITLAVSLTVAHFRGIALAAHTLAFILAAAWDAAFIVRTITDHGTTGANVIGWATYTALVVRSATIIDTYIAPSPVPEVE